MTKKQRIVPLSEMSGGKRDIVCNLPRWINTGIGKVIMTHAILENKVSELVYELAQVSYPAGRVAIIDRNAWDQFKVAIELINMHGIAPTIAVNELKAQIEDCCKVRDMLAHGIWMKDKDGSGVVIRIQKGKIGTTDGTVNRKYKPPGYAIPSDYFKDHAEVILSAIEAVIALKDEVKIELAKRKETKAGESAMNRLVLLSFVYGISIFAAVINLRLRRTLIAILA